MLNKVSLRLTMIIIIIVGIITGASVWASKENSKGLIIKWGTDFQSISFHLEDKSDSYPDAMLKDPFLSRKGFLDIKVLEGWPVYGIRARWTMPTADFSKKYREHALDLVLMRACDANIYTRLYAKVIKASKVTLPLQFRLEAKDPVPNSLIEIMRGKKVGYEITAEGGVGAKDYTISTEIHVGVSKDGKTVFYYDKPKRISEHLSRREILFAAHDAGDHIRFEVIAYCECAPRRLFRDEMMKRVNDDSRYLIEQMKNDLDAAL